MNCHIRRPPRWGASYIIAYARQFQIIINAHMIIVTNWFPLCIELFFKERDLKINFFNIQLKLNFFYKLKLILTAKINPSIFNHPNKHAWWLINLQFPVCISLSAEYFCYTLIFNNILPISINNEKNFFADQIESIMQW